jgi:hypothetical protein
MLPTTSRQWLLLTGKFALSLIFALPLTVLLSIQGAHAQPAKAGPISIQSVWTSDEGQNSKTTFAPVDGINYHVDFDNNTGGQLQVDVQEEIIPNDHPWGGGFSYSNTFSIQVPGGLTRLYTPETVPPTAVTGSFSIRISVSPSNSSDPANDGDWGEGDFSVYSSTNIDDVNKRIRALQNGAMCAGDIVSFGSDELLLDSVKTATEAQGFFEDEQSGASYVGYVKLLPGASCVELILELNQQ